MHTIRWSRKKKLYLYREASHVSQRIFGWLTRLRTEEASSHRLVYVDETGIEEGDQDAYGWSLQGKHCLAKRSGSKGSPFNSDQCCTGQCAANTD